MTQAILRMRHRMGYLTGYRMRSIPLRFLWGVPINALGFALLLQGADTGGGVAGQVDEADGGLPGHD